MDEILKQLAALDGAADLVASVRERLNTAATDADALRVEARKASKALTTAEAARDAALAAAETVKGTLADEQAGHKAYRLAAALSEKLGISDTARRAGALKLGDWSAVDLDDKGALVGADTAIAALTEAHGYLFTPAAQGGGGPAAGSQARTAASGGQSDPEAAAREAGRNAAMSHLGIKPPAAHAA